MKLCKFQLALGIVMCASGAGVAVRVIIGLMTKGYASFLTIAVILLVMCLLIIAIGVRFLILVRKPKPNSTKRREFLRLIIGTIALTLFCAYSFHYFSFVQNMLYTTQSVIASDSVAKEIKFAGEPFKYYTNIRQEDGHTVIDMTGLQKYGNMVNCKEDLNSSIDAFENIDPSYRVEYDDTYSSVEFYCDEKGIDNHALIEIDNILYKLSLIKMLQDPTGTWSIQTSMYNCHTNEKVYEFQYPTEDWSWSKLDWNKSSDN